MSKLCKPYKNASFNHISQIFGVNPQPYQPNGHTGVDFVAPYGTFLVAPEFCRVTNIITSENLDTSLAPLERGYGIVLSSMSCPNTYYLYWHCCPIFPVKIGDQVAQGQPVAMMGDSGFCMNNGKVVPLNIRTVPPYLGTHLHAEMFTEINGVRTYMDITKYIDWNIEVKYDVLTVAKEILNKVLNILKK